MNKEKAIDMLQSCTKIISQNPYFTLYRVDCPHDIYQAALEYLEEDESYYRGPSLLKRVNRSGLELVFRKLYEESGAPVAIVNIDSYFPLLQAEFIKVTKSIRSTPAASKTGKIFFDTKNKTTTYLMPERRDPVVVKTHLEDEFDRYVGAALAYAYSKFGSKAEFRRWVDDNSKEVKSSQEKKQEREAAKQKAIQRKKVAKETTDSKVEEKGEKQE
jgi:hypothetical protein